VTSQRYRTYFVSCCFVCTIVQQRVSLLADLCNQSDVREEFSQLGTLPVVQYDVYVFCGMSLLGVKLPQKNATLQFLGALVYLKFRL
jgi:hypothetical protein